MPLSLSVLLYVLYGVLLCLPFLHVDLVVLFRGDQSHGLRDGLARVVCLFSNSSLYLFPYMFCSHCFFFFFLRLVQFRKKSGLVRGSQIVYEYLTSLM